MEVTEQVAALAQRPLKRGDSFIVDFGRHMAGYVSFKLSGTGEAVDSPVRLRVTFGEAPADVAVPLESYTGTLSRAWLPDEILNVDFLPRRVEVPRRHAFRWVKFDVIDTSPNFAVHFERIEARAVTSAIMEPAPLPAGTPEALRSIDRVSLNTLRDCMQTVFEDGPRRDRRLWVGDLRLQALTNYVSFRNFDLVKRCLYLFAGLPREDGLVAACVYDDPGPKCGRQFIMDYAVLYIAALLDYVKAAKDQQTARELWPVVRKQVELVSQFINADGLFADPGGWWIFIDWREELEKTASMHGVLLFCLKQAVELAGHAGQQADAAKYQALIHRMTAAGRTRFFDSARNVFVSGPQGQVSWASQAWMVMSGLATPEMGAVALRNAMKMPDAVRPGTPYLYHYMVEAMLLSGLRKEALDLLSSYWGGMVAAGADTFWEIYDPSDPMLSPYKSILVNSYCHAWSCTPSYFLRGLQLGRTAG
ncbi:glycoside hydrolase [Paludibaculum fermentans]|uniref:Glycoside hydrolase n=2 Tax=Paludibaculum fermentans TaxID=1473598 RepID=A0A7S7NY01_PALFE|nr:glycoside hydrolase [Paludibaculum fermentans]